MYLKLAIVTSAPSSSPAPQKSFCWTKQSQLLQPPLVGHVLLGLCSRNLNGVRLGAAIQSGFQPEEPFSAGVSARVFRMRGEGTADSLCVTGSSENLL